MGEPADVSSLGGATAPASPPAPSAGREANAPASCAPTPASFVSSSGGGTGSGESSGAGAGAGLASFGKRMRGGMYCATGALAAGGAGRSSYSATADAGMGPLSGGCVHGSSATSMLRARLRRVSSSSWVGVIIRGLPNRTACRDSRTHEVRAVDLVSATSDPPNPRRRPAAAHSSPAARSCPSQGLPRCVRRR